VRPEARFAAWQKTFETLFRLRSPLPSGDTFGGNQRVWVLGNTLIAEITTDKCSFRSVPFDRHSDYIILGVVTSGSARLKFGRGILSLGPGDGAIWSSATEFCGRCEAATIMLMFVSRPEKQMFPLGVGEAVHLATPMHSILLGYVTSLVSTLPRLKEDDVPKVNEASWAMITSCLSSPRPGVASVLRSTTLFHKACYLIESELMASKLDAVYLKHELRVSRSVLYMLFAPFGGVSRYIQSRRLRAAYGELSRGGAAQKISDLAERYGFSDLSEFDRAFKREFGRTPSAIQTASRRNAPSPDQSDHIEGLRLAALLRDR
jgi:AraC-like DNA-binding protein